MTRAAQGTAPALGRLDAAFALLPHDEATARDALLALAEATPQAMLRRLAAAGAVLAVAAEFADFRGLADALKRLGPADRARWPRPERPQDQARLDAALVAVPLLDAQIATDDADVVAAAERLGVALAGPVALSADERVLLWKVLFDYRAQRLDTTALARIAAQAQDFLRGGGVSPRWQAHWWLLVARNHEYFGAAEAAADALWRAGKLAQAHGLAAVQYELLCVEMTAALKAEAWQRAEVLAREIEIALPDMRAGRLPAGLRAQAWWLLWRGQPGAALQRLDRLLAICEDVQVPQRDRGAYQVLRAYALLALQREDDAVQTLQAQRPWQQGDQGALLEVLIGLADALRALRGGEADGRARVCDAVRACAALPFDRFLLPLPALAAQVAEIALDAGVETEFVTRAIRSRRLAPTDPAREAWPWRLQLRLLGGLQVLRDGQPLSLGPKRPKKPLELLALLAAQGGRALSHDAAIDTLWPDPEADAPKASLEAALARLRKLLDLPGVVLQVDGGLLLDGRMAWSDVAAFDALELRALAALRAGAASPDAAGRAIALYRGHLLAGDAPGPAWARWREPLARRFLQLVLAHGAALSAQGRWLAAQGVYEQGLASDPLAEPLYRALMRVQLQLGERAEALRIYGRCRELLAAGLGATPSQETVALRDQAERTGA